MGEGGLIVVDIPRFQMLTKLTHCMISFNVCNAKLWNCIQKTVNTEQSLDLFKSKLDNFIMGGPDFPPVTGYSTANKKQFVGLVNNNFVKLNSYKEVRWVYKM